MTGMIRKATILVALGVVAASVAMAGVPSAANSTIPACIKVVGTNSVGVADPRGLATVTIRDIGGNGVSNVLVTLDFVNCTDMKLCTVASIGLLPVVPTTTCPVVSALTNNDGIAYFTVVGAAKHPGTTGFAGPGSGCITVRANGILMGTATANVYDLNGAFGPPTYPGNGVSIADLPCFLKDWAGGTGPYLGRSDFNQSGTLTIGDLVPWLGLWGPNASASGCTGKLYCNP